MILYMIIAFFYIVFCEKLSTATWNPAPNYLALKAAENDIENAAAIEAAAAAEEFAEAKANNAYADVAFDNLLNSKAAADAEIKAEASRRVAEAAARIAQEEAARAQYFNSNIAAI